MTFEASQATRLNRDMGLVFGWGSQGAGAPAGMIEFAES